MVKKHFNTFLYYAVFLVLTLPMLFGVLYLGFSAISMGSNLRAAIILITYILIILGYQKYKTNIKNKLLSFNSIKLLTFIIITGFTLRLLWIILVPTTPVSDFQLIYETGGLVHNKNFSSLQGTAYFARFTHNVVSILYYSVFYSFTDNPLFLIKLSNVICQTAVIYALYLIVKKLFDEKRALLSAAFIAFFPPFIMYSSAITSENIALPLYLFSIYLFLCSVKDNKGMPFLILSGVLLSFANMFRMVGVIFIIAYVVYNIIYKKIKISLKNSLLLVAAYFIPLFLVSQTLLMTNITDTHLWKPKESSFTSMLRGSNIKYHGRWNEEDAALPEKYKYDMEKVNAEAKRIVIERMTTTPLPQLAGHFISKIAMQWGMGDFGSSGWTIPHSENRLLGKVLKNYYHEINFLIQLIYLTMLIRIIRALLQRDYADIEEVNFFYILFGGFVLLYLISENQERYAFIVSWIFVILQTRFKNKPA
jgi:hypothetical protein